MKLKLYFLLKAGLLSRFFFISHGEHLLEKRKLTSSTFSLYL